MDIEWEKRKVSNADVYRIRKSSGNRENHPDYPEPMTEEQCDKCLQEIGCFAKVALSPRVDGNACDEPVIISKFYACDRDTFDQAKDEFFRDNVDQINDELWTKYKNHRFQNPFVQSERHGPDADTGRYKGQLHNRWEVFDFNTQKNSAEGWKWDISLNSNPRLTVCYDGNILGVAIRYSTGETVENNSISTTSKSMYMKNR
jgi:hypothetical protein